MRTLASVYSSKAGTGVTHTFLSELKDIAKLSGKSFEDILQEELTRITETIREQTPVEVETVTEPTPIQPLSENVVTPSSTAIARFNLTQAQMEPPPYLRESKLTDRAEIQPHAEPTAAQASPVEREPMHDFSLSADHLSTPEVQRVVVEHIVKSTDIASQFHSPAKVFLRKSSLSKL